MKRVPFKFLPRYRPVYRKVYRPRFQPSWQPRWDALIERRRLQRHAYTPEELEKRMPGLLERYKKRHERYAQEAKAHEEAMKGIRAPKVIPYWVRKLQSGYHRVPKYRPTYTRRFARKAKYRCPCGAGFLWMGDFLNHIKVKHKGKRPLGLPTVSS